MYTQVLHVPRHQKKRTLRKLTNIKTGISYITLHNKGEVKRCSQTHIPHNKREFKNHLN